LSEGIADISVVPFGVGENAISDDLHAVFYALVALEGRSVEMGADCQGIAAFEVYDLLCGMGKKQNRGHQAGMFSKKATVEQLGVSIEAFELGARLSVSCIGFHAGKSR
jgi:hypothetical protein